MFFLLSFFFSAFFSWFVYWDKCIWSKTIVCCSWVYTLVYVKPMRQWSQWLNVDGAKELILWNKWRALAFMVWVTKFVSDKCFRIKNFYYRPTFCSSKLFGIVFWFMALSKFYSFFVHSSLLDCLENGKKYATKHQNGTRKAKEKYFVSFVDKLCIYFSLKFLTQVMSKFYHRVLLIIAFTCYKYYFCSKIMS